MMIEPKRKLTHVVATLLFSFSLARSAYSELRPLPEPANPDQVSVVLIGDSTVRNGDGSGGNGQWGWGEPLAELFDLSKVNVVNRAVGGLSSRTYDSIGYWEATKKILKPGDFLLIQFGHNDAAPINDDQRARGTIRGNGEEAEQIVNQLTGQPETVHTYGWYVRKYIAEAVNQGVHPIVCSPVPRKSWNGQTINRSSQSYGLWARQAAQQESVPFIDLNGIIADQYDAMGPSAVEPLFADKHTHTTLEGARLNASCVVAGLLAIPGCVLQERLSDKATHIQAAKPTHIAIPDDRPILEDTGCNEAASRHSDSQEGGLPTIYLLGDSTVRNGHLDGVGWGEVIGQYFDTEQIHVVNRAIGGRSTRSFMREQRWHDVLEQLQPGDFVIMQFGHNGGGRVGDPRFKRRAALPGIGDETQTVTFEDGSQETVHSYGWYLRQFCQDTIAKRANPIICSPVPHKDNWRDGVFTPDFAEHRKWCRAVAQKTGASFFDLTQLIGVKYQQLGERRVDTLFADARTHTNAAGAQVAAECVIAGLKSLPNRQLKRFLSSAGLRVDAAPLVSNRSQ